MKAVYLEGTPEELLMALKDLTSPSSSQGVVLAVREHQDDSDAEGGEATTGFVSYELAKAILERKPLSKSHILLLKSLTEAHPGYVSSPDLMAKLGLTSAQFRGFMGAFGRRISYTPGYEQDEGFFFDQYWDEELSCFQYRLPDSSTRAVKELGVLSR